MKKSLTITHHDLKRLKVKSTDSQIISPVSRMPKTKGVTFAKQEIYRGPLPHPSLLRQFNDVIENGAERIIQMAEQQVSHRINIEEQTITTNNQNSRLGVIFGGTIGILGILGAIILALFDKEISAGLLGGGTLTSLVGVFIYGTRKDLASLNKKQTKPDDDNTTND